MGYSLLQAEGHRHKSTACCKRRGTGTGTGICVQRHIHRACTGHNLDQAWYSMYLLLPKSDFESCQTRGQPSWVRMGVDLLDGQVRSTCKSAGTQGTLNELAIQVSPP
eukprot:1137360-Pelagomonas_calceolata.AAC.1